MRFKKSRKVYIHVDCDSFFAECEILKNPKLKNEYVLVGEEIVLACNYKCKDLGIKTGTPVWQAREKLGEKAIFLPSDHNFYSFISEKLMYFLNENTYNVEPFSIDEAFCEVSGLAEMNKVSLEKYIKKLQKDIIEYVGVPVSIGVSTTRIKAKIFSKLNKPKGIFIDTGDSREVYESLNLGIVPFIGPSMQNKLKYSCNNVYDFIKLGYLNLKKQFGKNATDLWLELSGVNAYIVKKTKINKSISRGRSFNKNITNNKDFLYSQLLLNFGYLYEEFTIKNFETKKISIFFRDKEKITHMYNLKLSEHTFLRDKLLLGVKKLFINYYNENMLYRSTGIVFSDLKKRDFHQTNIFENVNVLEKNNLNLINTINKINSKFSTHKISFGSDLLNKRFDSKLGIRK